MNIILACNAGMSTSMMKMRLQQETEKRNMEATVKAVPMSELDEYGDKADIILLGPQVKFIANDVKEQYPNIPVVVMDMRDYGAMNAAVVLDKALSELEK